MPTFEMSSDDQDNPYRAIVAAGSSFAAGAIRITPPFFPSSGWLEFVGSESKIEIRDWVSDSRATTFWYEAMDTEDFPLPLTYEQRIAAAAREMILELGNLASERLFLKYNS